MTGKTFELPLFAMKETAWTGALINVAETSPEAIHGLEVILAQAAAGQVLASAVAAMITDLFGGSNPRDVAQAARAALAVYGITKSMGAGANMLKQECGTSIRPPPEHANQQFHWVSTEHGVAPMAFVQATEMWWRLAWHGCSTPSQAAAYGWRYVGPCVPPEVGP